MKKKIIFIATFMVIVATAVAVVSCKKERHDQNANGSEQTVQTADNMDEYLMAFKKKLLSAEKGGETISLEQAERDLGNLLNFDFGDANFVTDKIRYDTFYIPVELEGSFVDMAQLANTYNMAFANILGTYNQVGFPEKSVLFITCSINQDKKNENAANVRFVLATGGLPSCGYKTSFDSTDNWRVWGELGKCDGTCVGDDHTTMIKKVYQNNMPLLECHNGRIYYTDVNETLFWGYDFPDDNTNYNYGYQFWCGNGSEMINHCIEYPEMQYYYNNFCQVMGDESMKPQGHVIVSIDSCFLDHTVSVVYPELWYVFCCYYTTGKPNCTSVGPDY